MGRPEDDDFFDLDYMLNESKKRAEVYIKALIQIGILTDFDEAFEISNDEFVDRVQTLANILDEIGIDKTNFFLSVIAKDSNKNIIH